jgi:hypothetical protein
MESSETKDASEQASQSERAELPETLFGYSRSSEVPTDSEDGDLEGSPLE